MSFWKSLLLAAGACSAVAFALGSSARSLTADELGRLGAGEHWGQSCGSAGGTCDNQNGCEPNEVMAICGPAECVHCGIAGTQKECSFPGLVCWDIVGLNCNAGEPREGLCRPDCTCEPIGPAGTCTGNTSSCL